MAAVNDMERLIELSYDFNYEGIQYLYKLNNILPGYNKRIKYFEKIKKTSDNEESDISDFYIANPELLEKYVIVESDEESNIDLSNLKYGQKVILYDKKKRHFAALYMSKNKTAYLMDSLPEHSKWKFNSDYTINSIPVPLQKTNNCAINALTNLDFAARLKKIFDLSKIKKNDIEKLSKFEKKLATYKTIKTLLESNKHNLDNVKKILNSDEKYLMLETKKINKIINSITDDKSFDEQLRKINGKINKYKNYKVAIYKKIQNSNKIISNKQSVISLDKNNSNILANEVEKFEEIKRDYSARTSVASNTFERVIDDEIALFIKDKKLSKAINELKEIDRDFAQDIVANIKLSTELKTSHAEKEKARKQAVKIAKQMLGIER